MGAAEDSADLFSGSAVTVPASAGADAASGGPGTTTTAAAGIVVHAAGAVSRPGLYRLPRMPGWPTSSTPPAARPLETDLDRVNLAAPLADGQRLYVPRRGEVVPGGGGPRRRGARRRRGRVRRVGPRRLPSGPIDLNTATAEQLDTLPGVGPATAAAIVSHRERNGPFATVDGLLDVRGIGPAKLEALRDLVTVG